MSSIVWEQKEQLKRERLEDARVRRIEARDRANLLAAQADARQRRNQVQHMRGEHVGTRPDETGCMDCKNYGDLPLLGLDTMTERAVADLRAGLLERNIAAIAEAMRTNSAFSALERELGLSVEVAD